MASCWMIVTYPSQKFFACSWPEVSQWANLHAAQPTLAIDDLARNINEIVSVAIEEMPTEIPLCDQPPSAPWNRTKELIRGM